MKSKRWMFAAVLSAGLVGALPLTGRAQIAPQQSAMAQAHKEVADATAEVARTRLAVDRARQRSELVFAKTNPGYAAAQKNYQKAVWDVKTITAAAMASLQQKPEYIEAVKAEKAAKENQTKLLAPDSKASEDEKQAAFSDVVAKKQLVTDMEATVTQADPRVVDAKQRLSDARDALEGFKAQIDAVCAADPEYKQAVQMETGAQQRLAQARASLDQQTKAAAAAAAASKSKTPRQPGSY